MYSDKKDLLNKAKDLLKEEMSNIAYSTWVKSLDIQSINNNKITLIASSTVQKDAIESRYYDLVLNTFNFITNKSCEIKIIDNDPENNINYIEKDETPSLFEDNETYQKTGLIPKYTFDNFIIGNNNNFAQAAAYAVSESPAMPKYNPLFIYGGAGLGKTHLINAIGNKIFQSNSGLKILYVTSEKFINELINGLKDPNFKNELFRKKYRNIDILIIDDIQFLSDKKTGQEEFFHTFNSLHQDGKQIIISCDRPPKDIPLLEERLKSRLEWGILADVSMPDYETRLAILRNKVQNENIIIDDYILQVIATKINSNIRELEGTLNKTVAYAALTHTPITLELAEKSIKDVVLQKEKVINALFVQEVVAKYFNIDRKDLISSKKSNEIVFPRQIAMYLCRTVANLSYPQIGKEFGNKDHTTVMHSCTKIEDAIKFSTNTKLIVESLKNLLLENR